MSDMPECVTCTVTADRYRVIGDKTIPMCDLCYREYLRTGELTFQVYRCDRCHGYADPLYAGYDAYNNKRERICKYCRDKGAIE